jgi:hypothetical protein
MSFNYGDQVRWMDSRVVGRGFRFTQKHGRVVGLNGDWMLVRLRNGRDQLVATSKLEPDGAGPGPLTRAVLDLDANTSGSVDKPEKKV